MTCSGRDPATELCRAAASGDLDQLRSLAESGVDVNLGDYDRRTAMHLAASENQLEIVKFLLAAGVDANPIDRWGGRPLDDALRQGHQRVVDLLKQHGGKGGKRDRRPSIFGSLPRMHSHKQPATEPAGADGKASWVPLSLIGVSGDAKLNKSQRDTGTTSTGLPSTPSDPATPTQDRKKPKMAKTLSSRRWSSSKKDVHV